jgi:hypothetical protein
MKVKLTDRIRMAWFAFNCKPFEIYIEPYHFTHPIIPGYKCDIRFGTPEACPNPAEICESRTLARFNIQDDYDHQHVCLKHAAELAGKY